METYQVLQIFLLYEIRKFFAILIQKTVGVSIINTENCIVYRFVTGKSSFFDDVGMISIDNGKNKWFDKIPDLFWSANWSEPDIFSGFHQHLFDCVFICHVWNKNITLQYLSC